MRKLALMVAMLAMVLATAAPAFAADRGRGGGATIEEFVCFFSAGDNTRLGEGKVVTTPSGKTHIVCTGKPIS
ncbi:hypothetical protein BH20ACT11_BH20ACT11_16700 [soil metagenome]|jgi:hypothetical protein